MPSVSSLTLLIPVVYPGPIDENAKNIGDATRSSAITVDAKSVPDALNGQRDDQRRSKRKSPTDPKQTGDKAGKYTGGEIDDDDVDQGVPCRAPKWGLKRMFRSRRLLFRACTLSNSIADMTERAVPE